MLPDYPKTKAKLWKAYMKVVERSQQDNLGFLEGIKSSFMHEGALDQLEREDGSTSEMTPKHVRTDGFIPAESRDVEKLDMEKVLKGLHEVGQRMAEAKVAFPQQADTKRR